MPEKDTLITVGKITGTHGVRGLLKVYSYSGNFDSLLSVSTVILKSPGGESREFEVKSASPHAGKLIFGLKGFDDINQVLDLVGSEICLPRNQLPEPGEDEYYWCDLLGLEVATTDGTVLGSIVDIFETGSNDVYVVRGGKKEYLIPAVASVISSVDLEGGRMLVTPLEGLLEL